MPFDPKTAKPVRGGFDPSTAKPVDAAAAQAALDSAPVGSVGAPGGVQPAGAIGRGGEGSEPFVSDVVRDPEFWTRDIPRNLSDQLPTIGGIAGGLAVPGAGWLGLAGQAAAAGLGSGAGSLLDSAVGDLMDPGGKPRLDLGKAGKEAALSAGGTLAVGAMFKGLFGDGTIDDVANKAIDFAKQRKLPAPAEALGVRGKIATSGGRGTVLGTAEYIRQAGKISQAIDNEVASMASTRSPDEVVAEGRKFLSMNFDPRLYFKKMQEIIPKDMPVVLGDMMEASRAAIPRLEEIGDEPLRAKLTTILENASDNPSFLFDQADGLMTELQKLRSPGNSKILDTVIGSMKDDVALAVSQHPEIAAAAEAQGGVVEMYNKAGKHSFNVIRKLQEAPQIKQMMLDRTGPPEFMAKFSTSETIRHAIREIAPDLHDDLAVAWLGRNADVRLSGPDANPAKFARFLSENQRTIRDMFGDDRFNALTNFSAYMKFAGETARLGEKAKGGLLADPAVLMARLGTEYGTLGLPTTAALEGGGWLMVNRLMDPNSGMFRLFSEGPGKAAIPAGVLSGQAAGAAGDALNSQ